MPYTGHVENGIVILDEPAGLPEGVRVRIDVIREGAEEVLHPDIIRFTGVLPSTIDARAEYLDAMRKKHS